MEFAHDSLDQEEDEDLKLPLLVQSYLWNQSRRLSFRNSAPHFRESEVVMEENRQTITHQLLVRINQNSSDQKVFLKAKRIIEKYETYCVGLESVICSYKLEDIRVQLPGLANSLDRDTTRWKFVQGALPFIMHCCSPILSNRDNLNLSDRLTVAVTKLLYTLHWCLLDAPAKCGIKPAMGVFPLRTIELFVQLLAPYARCVREVDLTFSLESGIAIWQPLWNHYPPSVQSLTRKVFHKFDRNEADATAKSSYSLVRLSDINKDKVASYFDIAVLKCLSRSQLTEDGLLWSLMYVSRILQSEIMSRSDLCESWPSLNFGRFGSKRAATAQQSVPGILSQLTGRSGHLTPGSPKPGSGSASPVLCNYGLADEDEDPLRLYYIPKKLEEWVSEKGQLRLLSILKVIQYVIPSATVKVYDTLMYNLHMLIELGVANQSSGADQPSKEFNIAMSCLLNLIQVTGCDTDQCLCGVKGYKGDYMRQIAHESFSKLTVQSSKSTLKVLEEYIQGKDAEGVLDFLHAFTGFCFHRDPASPCSSELDRGVISPMHASLHSSTSTGIAEMKLKNEKNLFSWISDSILEKFKSEEEYCNQFAPDLVSKLLVYMKTNHERSTRKVVMSGLLNSFRQLAASTEPSFKQNEPEKEGSKDLSVSPKSKRKMLLRECKPRALSDFNVSPRSSSLKGRKLLLSRLKGLSTDALDAPCDDFKETSNNNSPSTLPRTLSSSLKEKSTRERTGSIKAMLGLGKGIQKRPKTPSSSSSSLAKDENMVRKDESTPITVENSKPKPVPLNLVAVKDGMERFRFLLQFTPAGQIPEVSVLGAMLDLKAPVVARASLLLECAHFVHRCSQDDWPHFSRSELSRREAAQLFFKWGIAVGVKLEELLSIQSPDIAEAANTTYEEDNNEDEIDFINQGDLESKSNLCPFGLKAVACLLLLEITGFLREFFRSFADERKISGQRDRAWTSSSKGSSDGHRISSHVPFMRQKSGSRAPVISVQEGNKVKRNASISYTAKTGIASSPSYQRKLSRRQSRCYLPPPERKYSRALKDAQPFGFSSSFEDEEEMPDEAWNFPWMIPAMDFIKSAHSQISLEDDKMEHFLFMQAESCRKLSEALKQVYSSEERRSDYNRQSRAEVYSFRQSFVTKEAEVPDEADQEPDLLLEYLRTQGAGLHHSPFSLLCKAALVTDKVLMLGDIMRSTWELLLLQDQQLVSSVASVFLICAAQHENILTSFIKTEMSKADPAERAKTVQKFGVLWSCRYHVWKKMERNAHFRIPPLKVDYTLPSPLIGRDPSSAPDAPWVPGSPLPEEMEDSENEEQDVDEKKRQEAKMKRAEEKLTKLRLEFHLRTVSFSKDASFDIYFRDEDDNLRVLPWWSSNQDNMEFFPPAVCAVVPDLIRLLGDSALDASGQSIGNYAHQVVWKCLVDDPDLFFRTVYEKITKSDRQDEMLLVLRKLLSQIPVLPPEAGTLLFNNLAGVIMYYSRTNRLGSHEKITAVLSVIWQVVPSVSYLYFKDMKERLRKEHCDFVLMVSANAPTTKEVKVIYRGNTKNIKKQEVREDMTFGQLLKQCKEAFDANEPSTHLVCKHSGQILEKNTYVREVYTYKRGYPAPLVKLETLDPMRAIELRQLQLFHKKIAEISKLLLSGAIFNMVPSQKHVTFLYSELYKQTAFPRKAIETEFDLCQGHRLGRELSGLDVVLKDSWVKFICNLLVHMDESTTQPEEIELFLNVLNGALLLLCEDVVILRSCLAGFINLSKHFQRIFSVNGYQFIMPTILRVYSHHQDNTLVKETIEFAVSQFCCLHQSPFILQLFASVAPILETEAISGLFNAENEDMVPAKCLFLLLQSLDRKIPDSLEIMSLVHGEKPLKPFDDVCKIDSTDSKIDVAIRLAVTVIDYCSDSVRGRQMLTVLAGVIPHYFQHLQQQTESATVRQETVFLKELKELRMLVSYVKVVVGSFKYLCSHFKDERSEIIESAFDDESTRPGFLSMSWWSEAFSNFLTWFGIRKSGNMFVDDSDKISVVGADENLVTEELRKALRNFYLPRMVLLYLVSEFATKCPARAKTLKAQIITKKGQFPECVLEDDHTSILTNLIASLLSMAPKYQGVLASVGLQRFILEALPSIKWTGEIKEKCFRDIVQRFTNILQRISSRSEQMELVNWDAIEVYLRGINCAIKKQRKLALMAMPELKALITCSINLIITDTDSVPPNYCPVGISFASMAAKLTARMIQSTDSMKIKSTDSSKDESEKDRFGLRAVIRNVYDKITTPQKIERFFLHWLLPLCIRLGTGRYDYPRLSVNDVLSVSEVLLHWIIPNKREKKQHRPESISSIEDLSEYQPSYYHRRNSDPITVTPEIYKAVFLGLKILIIGFEDCLGSQWRLIADTLELVLEEKKDEPTVWDFLHFIVLHRSPLHLHLWPVLLEKVSCDENLPSEIRSHKTRIERDLWSPPACPCKGHVLRQLLDELIDMTRPPGQEKQKLPYIGPPPEGRRKRSSTTYSTEEPITAKLDRLNRQLSEEVFEEKESKRPNRKSTKRVSFQDKPHVVTEDSTDSGMTNTSEVSDGSTKRKQMLKRQVSIDNEGPESSDSEAGDDASKERVNVFKYQRKNVIRKGEPKWTRTKRRKDWLSRKGSMEYKKKMFRQVSEDPLPEEDENESSETYGSERHALQNENEAVDGNESQKHVFSDENEADEDYEIDSHAIRNDPNEEHGIKQQAPRLDDNFYKVTVSLDENSREPDQWSFSNQKSPRDTQLALQINDVLPSEERIAVSPEVSSPCHSCDSDSPLINLDGEEDEKPECAKPEQKNDGFLSRVLNLISSSTDSDSPEQERLSPTSPNARTPKPTGGRKSPRVSESNRSFSVDSDGLTDEDHSQQDTRDGSIMFRLTVQQNSDNRKEEFV